MGGDNREAIWFGTRCFFQEMESRKDEEWEGSLSLSLSLRPGFRDVSPLPLCLTFNQKVWNSIVTITLAYN